MIDFEQQGRMLFKIKDTLIVAESEDEARCIYTKALDSPVIFIEEERESTAPLDDLYQECISDILFKYTDSIHAVERIVKSKLTDDQLDGICQTLLSTKYNETESLLLLLASVGAPDRWKKDLLDHASKYWISGDIVASTFWIDLRNEHLLEIIGQKGTVVQKRETVETIDKLERASYAASRVLSVLNSVNFSYETLESFVERHGSSSWNWVLDHYHFKQKLIRAGAVNCINEP